MVNKKISVRLTVILLLGVMLRDSLHAILFSSTRRELPRLFPRACLYRLCLPG